MLCFMSVGFSSNGGIFLIPMHYTQLICLLKLHSVIMVYLVVV